MVEKLTDLLKGRTISGTGNANDALTIHFSDNSQLTIKTRGNTNSASTGGTIASAEQTKTALTLTMDGGGTFEIPLAETELPIKLHSGNKTEYEG